MRRYLFVILILCGLVSAHAYSMGSKSLGDLETAKNVELNRYIGKWFEIARIEQRFEKGCVGSTAEYSLRADGKIAVKNTCRVRSCSGRISKAKGVARVVDLKNNAKLKVSFFWPFEGDYWILELDPEYNYAVVGSPDRKSFWILSRTPTLPNDLVQSILSHFQTKGFSLDKVVFNEACE